MIHNMNENQQIAKILDDLTDNATLVSNPYTCDSDCVIIAVAGGCGLNVVPKSYCYYNGTINNNLVNNVTMAGTDVGLGGGVWASARATISAMVVRCETGDTVSISANHGYIYKLDLSE